MAKQSRTAARTCAIERQQRADHGRGHTHRNGSFHRPSIALVGERQWEPADHHSNSSGYIIALATQTSKRSSAAILRSFLLSRSFPAQH